MRATDLGAIALVLCFSASAAAAGGPPAPASPTATAEAERLVARLGSSDPAEREAAAAALVALGAPAIAPLKAELARLEAPAARIRALIAAIEPSAAPGGERWYEAKFKEAAKRVERGDYLGAVKLLDAILIAEPDCPIRDRIQALKIRAKELHVRRAIIEARLVPKKVLLAPGEPIEITLEVKNVSTEPLELKVPDSPEGDIFGAIEAETLDASRSGGRARSFEIQRIGTAIQGRLEPGEVFRTLLAVKGPPPLAPGAFRRVTISGSIRSRVLVRRDERFDRFLPLFPVEVFVVDAARHALAADPIGALRGAIDALRKAREEREAEVLTERVFFAALLAPAHEREEAIEALGTALAADGDPAAPAAIAALAALTDGPSERDPKAWRAWLRRRAN